MRCPRVRALSGLDGSRVHKEWFGGMTILAGAVLVSVVRCRARDRWPRDVRKSGPDQTGGLRGPDGTPGCPGPGWGVS